MNFDIPDTGLSTLAQTMTGIAAAAAASATWGTTFGGHDQWCTSAADEHRAAEQKQSRWWPWPPGMRGLHS